MIYFYVNQIRLGKMILSDVPVRWRNKVEKELNNI